MIRTGLLLIVLNLSVLLSAVAGAGEGASAQHSLDVVRQLLSDVERSPSANLDDLRAKLLQARSMVKAAMNANADNPDALELSNRIEALLQSLAPRPRAEHPWLEEADAALDRLAGLVKNRGSCQEIKRVHAHVIAIASRVEATKPEQADQYRQQAKDLLALSGSDQCGEVQESRGTQGRAP
jgi:hypothetical protein